MTDFEVFLLIFAIAAIIVFVVAGLINGASQNSAYDDRQNQLGSPDIIFQTSNFRNTDIAIYRAKGLIYLEGNPYRLSNLSHVTIEDASYIEAGKTINYTRKTDPLDGKAFLANKYITEYYQEPNKQIPVFVVKVTVRGSGAFTYKINNRPNAMRLYHTLKEIVDKN